MEFSREELQIIHQAMTVAELYYKDKERRVLHMAKPDEVTIKMRLDGIGKVLDRISDYACTLR
jgi:hypothetical protein